MNSRISIPAAIALHLLALNLQAQVPPVITTQPTNQTVMLGSTARFSVIASGLGPFAYQWQLNGTNLPNDRINSVAGGNMGDGGYATNAHLRIPETVALDSNGNLFIADFWNHRIRKVATNGIVVTIAGNGMPGFAGDGGAGTNASLHSPEGLALDVDGNLYIADSENHCVRKLSTNGTISTVVGSGYYPGAFYGDDGPAAYARLTTPVALALDRYGNLFIADVANNRVRRLGTNGIITSVAGNGTFSYSGDGGMATNAGVNAPRGLAIDTAGNLFIADAGNNRVRKVTPSGIISTVAGNGTHGYSGEGFVATLSRLAPNGLALDAQNNLYIAEPFIQRIRIVDGNGQIWTVAGNGSYGFSGDGSNATSATLNYPYGVAVNPTGGFYIADSSNDRIRKVATDGKITTFAGGVDGTYSGDGGAATEARLNFPQDVAVGGSATIFVADSSNHRIRRIESNGIITTVAGNSNGGFSGDAGPATNASLNFPRGIFVDPTGNIFIADTSNHRVRKIGTNGIIATVAGNGTNSFSGDAGQATNASLSLPSGICLDPAGSLFITDQGNNRIRRVGTDGIIATVAGNGTSGGPLGDNASATNASIYFPWSVATDASGNLFISELGRNRIRKMDTNGIITTFAGNGSGGYSGDNGPATNASLFSPRKIVFDVTGNLFITDNYNNRIRKVNTNGVIQTVAGKGDWLYSGDDTVATDVTLNFPVGVSMDNLGNLLIADTSNHRIRKVAYAGNPNLTLVNVGANNSGDYNVIVTTPYGSTNSSHCMLTVLAPPAPLVVTPPTSLTALVGSNATFSVVASGLGPLTYQWRINGTNVPGGTLSSLTLTNVSASDAGNYSVVVSGPSGMIVGGPVSLTVLAGLSISLISPGPPGTVIIHFVGGSGTTYLVQATTNLTPPVIWHTVTTNIAAENGAWLYTDTNVFKYPTRFYRSATP